MNLEDLELNDAIMTRLVFNDFQDISDSWIKEYLNITNKKEKKRKNLEQELKEKDKYINDLINNCDDTLRERIKRLELLNTFSLKLIIAANSVVNEYQIKIEELTKEKSNKDYGRN